MADTNAPATTATGQTPGSADAANALASPTPEQVTQPSPVKPAEGARILKEAEKAAKKAGPSARPDFATIEESTINAGLAYDEAGVLRNDDGRPIALSADATDLDVGWTVQHAHTPRGGESADAIHYPVGSSVPDQTFHPSELPHPMSAIRAGLLPQNLSVLNIDTKKFDGKKSLEA